MIVSFNFYATLLSMIFVLLLGRFIIGKSKFCVIIIFQNLWWGESLQQLRFFCFIIMAK